MTGMDRGQVPVDHRYFEDLLAAAALDALSPEEHAQLVAHLPTCRPCQEATGRMRVIVESLPLAVEEREPPADLRERLLAEVGGDTRAQQWQPPVAPPAIAPLPQVPEPRPVAPGRGTAWPVWIAAAAAILLIGLLAGVGIDRFLLDGDEPSSVREIALQFPAGEPLTDASLSWDEDARLLRFSAPDIPSTPVGQVYQVWLFEDDTPLPFGVVDAGTGEYATVIDPDRYHTFAITVEPGPLGSPQPTSDPVIVASLDEPGGA